jgi:hypothetical protein
MDSQEKAPAALRDDLIEIVVADERRFEDRRKLTRAKLNPRMMMVGSTGRRGSVKDGVRGLGGKDAR